jgi:spore cortex biosynthesis protein YabQ
MGGLVLGLTFDAYRILRGKIRPGKFLAGLGDLVFWLIVTVIVATALVIGNYGELRLGALIGIALGLFIYYKALSRRTISLVLVGFKILGNILFFLRYLLQGPFIVCIRIGKRIFQLLYYSRQINRRKT